MLTHLHGVSETEATMDVDFWASKFHSSKHFSARLTSGSHSLLDNSEVSDDPRTYFTCPFCYVDTELSLLCNHLQEEHCFDVKNAVCPVCALNLGKDVVGHFKVHHASSIKTRRKSQKSELWGLYTGRGSIIGLNTKSSSENVNGSAPDPLLSPFLCAIPFSEPKGDESQESCDANDCLSILETESSKPAMLNQSQKGDQDSEELRQRAEFCQQLILSVIL